MKKSAIREMFLGNRGAYLNVEESQDYKKTKDEMVKAVESFIERLPYQHKESFDKVYEAIADKGVECANDHYIEGFKFGLAIGIEVGESQ